MSDEIKICTSNLISKLARVMGGVGRVAKRGRNDFHRYDFATEADIADSVRDSLAAEGVMVLPSIERIEWREVQTKNGSQTIATVYFIFQFTDGLESVSLKWVGEGQDTGDKAIYKAMTGAVKYLLLKSFLIPTGDDPEIQEKANPPGRREPVAARPRTPSPVNGSHSLPEPRVLDEQRAAEEDEATKWEAMFSDVETEQARQGLRRKFHAGNPTPSLRKAVEQFYLTAGKRLKAAQTTGGAA